ncbi:DNA polymerase III subunit delta [bacterium DOLZORAL124_64_63]|nr:MAG: DNA polymerase III subunit delta [bacterium DOLZORAL124_64_63]
MNKDLKTGEFRPVYLLAGSDTLRMEGVIEKMRQVALGEAGSAFNYHVLHGDQVGVDRVIQQALALPMMGACQLIWVKNADACLSTRDKQAAMEEYLAKPVKETILVLTCPKVDKRLKWVKNCVAAGYFFDFSPPEGAALVQWAQRMAAREGLELGRQEAETLCDLVGNDLLGLKNEINKLALLADREGGRLSSAELNRIIMDQAELQGFDITNDLMPGRTDKVLKTWFRLAEWGKSPYEIAPLLHARIRKGALLAACRDQGLSDQETARLTGSSPWGFRFLEPMIRGLGSRGIRDAMETSLDCDRRLKSSPLGPDVVLEKTIMELCRRRRG